MKKQITVLLIGMMVLMLASSALAFMPAGAHRQLHEETIAEPISSNLYNACVKFPDACYSGNVLTDISVVFYFTERGKYTTTHSPSFVKALVESSTSEQDLACVAGAMMHQAQDIVSHNKMVPSAIRKSFIANNVIHVFAEQHLDNWVDSNNPFLRDEAEEALLRDYTVCRPLFKKALIGEPQYTDLTETEIDSIFDKFVAEIASSTTGYDTAFRNKSFFVNIQALPFALIGIYSAVMLFFLAIFSLLLIKIIKGDRRARIFVGLILFGLVATLSVVLFIGNLQGSVFDTFITIIKPVSNLVPIGDPATILNEAMMNSREVLAQGELWLQGTEASGFTNLDAADRSILLFDYILAAIALGGLVWFLFFLFKKNKTKPNLDFAL